MRSSYWSCSRLADWIRGTHKPAAESSEGWHQWRQTAKKSHGFRYWLAEEALDTLQDIVCWPWDQVTNLRYYINNRFITRTHALTAHVRDIPRGAWQDVGNRFLPCLFNELVDFVEIEQAWHSVAWDKESQARFQPPFYRRWFNIRGWRCREAGLDYLNWAKNLRVDETWGVGPGDPGYGELTDQAKQAQEIEDLYRWWTEVYPNRPDPYEASGWSAVCEERRKNSDHFDDAVMDSRFKKKENRALAQLRKLEQQYEKEDTQMMIRLVKVRHSLWT